MTIKPYVQPFVKIIRTKKDLYNLRRYCNTDYYSQISSLKNKESGKRCFIIGNGPSLKIADLDRIKDDCFACNRIYGLYDKTEWRPKFYGIQDPKVMDAIVDAGELKKGFDGCKYVFLPYQMRNKFGKLLGNNKLRLFYKRYISIYSKDGKHQEGFIPFSDDMNKGLYDGMSITYGLMQLAVFMGYKEIYLLGIDHNYSINNGVVDAKNSYAEGIKPIDMSKQLPPELEICEISFREAKRYADSHGIIIKNATRGGKLEVFERINIEELF